MEGGEDQVAGECGLDGDGGGFLVTHFPDHDAVGVLAEEGAQDAGEIQADAFVDGDLDDTIDVIFDGILGGEELGIDGIDAADGRIEGGGFAGAGGAGDDEDAVGFLDRLGDIMVDVIGQAEVFQ